MVMAMIMMVMRMTVVTVVIPTENAFLDYVRSNHVVLTFRCFSDAPKLMCPPAPLTLMLKTSSLTDSSTNAAQIMLEYDGIDDGGDRNGDFNRKFHPRL